VIEVSVEAFGSNGRLISRVLVKRDGQLIHVDRISLESGVSRERLIRRVLEKDPGVPREELEAELLRQVQTQLQEATAPARQAAAEREIPPEQREKAMAMLLSPRLFDGIADDIHELGVEKERVLGQTLYVVMSSRVLARPLGAVVKGASSGGKSHAVKRVAELIPPESKFVVTNLTGNAFYYLTDPDCLVHKAVILGERKQSTTPEAIDENRAWRELLTDGELKRAVVVKDKVTGKLTTITCEVRGPIAYVESTTVEHLFEEDESRLLPLRVNESREQTRAVMARIARNAMGRSLPPAERQAIVEKHHAAQRLLEEFKGVPIVIPFAGCIVLPDGKVIARRVFEQVIAVIEAVALIRVFQKHEGQRNPIVADLDDYDIGRELLEPVVRSRLGTLSQSAEDLFRLLQDEFPNGKPFLAVHVAELLGVGDHQARVRMKELLVKNLARETPDSRRNLREWFIPPGASVASCDGLPTRYEIDERMAIRGETTVQES